MRNQVQHLQTMRLIAVAVVVYASISTSAFAQAVFANIDLPNDQASPKAINFQSPIFRTNFSSTFVRLVSNNDACNFGGSRCSVGCPSCTPVPPPYSGSNPGEMGTSGGSLGSANGGQKLAEGTPGSVAGDIGQGGTTSPQFDLTTNFNAPDSGGIGNPNYVAAAAIPGAYLDMAAPVTQFRLRYNDALDNKYPDRGEYFYGECGCFRTFGGDRNVKGPPGNNIANVNSQDARAYFEYAFTPRISVFAEGAVEFLHFNTVAGNSNGGNQPNNINLGNSSGVGDINAGFKYAFLAAPTEYFTFQLRTYIPTGDPGQGLGTGHVSIEPSLLYYKRLTNRWLVQGQLTEWSPIDVTAFASNVLEYGAGLGYILWRGDRVVVTPTFESVGWTFLGGRKFNPATGTTGSPTGVPSATGTSAAGDTIINIKPGVRIGLSDLDAPSGQQRHSLYFGWGHAVTSQQFYADIYRVEYRILF